MPALPAGDGCGQESSAGAGVAAVHRELRRPGVTLQLLWEEHRAVHPDGYGYSRYCELYRAWAVRLSPTMRQSHIAGERMFVDYAGATLEVIDPSTGEVMTAQLFVAALGASSYTYAEATWTQGRQIGSPGGHLGRPRPSSKGARRGRSGSTAEAAQLDAAGLGRSQRGLSAGRDRLSLVLGDGGEDVNGEPIGLREIDGFKLDARFHQVRNECNVAGEAIARAISLAWYKITA